MEKYGFIYIWLDKKHKRYYVGCHWGSVDDGYICSSTWMKQAYRIRPQDFKRRVIKTKIKTRPEMYIEELRYLKMIKKEEMKPLNETPKYYNLNNSNNEVWHKYDENIKTIGQKISAAKKGKKTGPCTPEKAKAISEAKKGKALSEAHIQALKDAPRPPHTDEWKENNSKKMKEDWVKNEARRAAVSAASKKRWEEWRKKKESLSSPK